MHGVRRPGAPVIAAPGRPGPPSGLAGALRSARAAARRRLDARPPGPPDAAARRRRDAAVHARRDERHRQGARSGRPARGRRHDHPVQHLPPLPAARPRANRRASAACTVHGLGPADPDRLGRLPGRLAGRAAQDRRRRRHLPEPPRRLLPPLHARAFDRRAGGARARTSPSPSTSPCRRPPRRARPSPRRPPGRIAGRSDRSTPTRGRTRPSSGSSRAAWIRTCGPSRPRFIAGLPFDGICIGGLAGDETRGAARGRAGRGRRAARRRTRGRAT